jgi:hypothetical protein
MLSLLPWDMPHLHVQIVIRTEITQIPPLIAIHATNRISWQQLTLIIQAPVFQQTALPVIQRIPGGPLLPLIIIHFR